MFSASPETIRREPRECDLLRSVGYRQDLAVCALSSYSLSAALGCCRAALLCRPEVSLLPVHGKQIRDHLPGDGEGRSIAISFLLFPVVDHGKLMALSRCQLGSFDQRSLICLLRCFESGIRIALSAELRSSPHRPQ